MPKRRGRSRQRRFAQGDALLGGMGGFLAGYIGAEAVLQRFMHPLHWAAATIVSVLSGLGVWLWYYWRRVWREERTPKDR